MKSLIAFFALATLLVGTFFIEKSRNANPFEDAPVGIIQAAPVQSGTPLPPFTMASFDLFKTEYMITPLAFYDIQARVLAKTRYISDGMSGDIIPYDFGLGWQEMSDLSVLLHYFAFEHVSMAGGMRGLYINWKFDKDGNLILPPTSLGKIENKFSNNHLIPANADIFEKLGSVHTGDMIRLKGHLIRLEDPKRPGWVLDSSTSRADTANHWGGNNSNCEIMYVTSVARIISTSPYLEEEIVKEWVPVF